jgi:Phage-related protein, predicted endonuclease
MSITELQEKIRELRQLQSLIDEAQAEAEAIRDTVKAYMGEQDEIRAGEYRVTYKAVKSVRVDTAALRQALPEVAARFSKETVTRRFCVA